MSILEDYTAAAFQKKPEMIPVSLLNNCPWITYLYRVKAKEYYNRPHVRMALQIALQERYPEVMLMPGIFPEFGSIIESSLFGCKIFWQENNAPYVKPALDNMKDAEYKYRSIGNLSNRGVAPIFLEQYAFLKENMPPEYKKKYGYLDGVMMIQGPIETAALIRGYTDFFIDLYDYPKQTLKFLDIIVQVLIDWIKTVEKISGKMKRIIICDHVSSMISRDHLEKFYTPYIKSLNDEFPNAIKIYHNEGRTLHILDIICRLGSNVFHCGPDIDFKKAKDICTNLTIMGNLDPKTVLSTGSVTEVKRETIRIMREGSKLNGFIFTNSAAAYTTTPWENLDTMINTAVSWAKKHAINRD
jgi:uroporphyrinogen decarboxylase